MCRMITFESVNKENLYIAKEMIESNSYFYESIDDGLRTKENELKALASNKNSFLIKVEDTYIGLVGYEEQPAEKNALIVLFLIHADYQGFGYGTTAYDHFEDFLVKEEYKKCSLNVSSENNRAKQFWERNGFVAFGQTKKKNIEMTHYEKQYNC